MNEFKQTFLKEIRQYILDEQLYKDPKKFKKFLDMIIPSNSQIFNILKKYIHNNISIVFNY